MQYLSGAAVYQLVKNFWQYRKLNYCNPDGVIIEP